VQGIVERQFSNKIAQVSGVGLVSMSGGQRPAVRIQANVPALAARGLAERSAARLPMPMPMAKGSFDGPTKSWTIDANDQLSDAPAIAAWSWPLPMARRCACPMSPGGQAWKTPAPPRG
jgi:multidrug efflux pump